MYGMIVLGVIILLVMIKILLRYEPKFDLVVSSNSFMLLLWYNKYYNNDEKKRVYKKLF